ncbi:hypothetical protein GPALN_003023 [Globodera pallida]|nr:hypothetical protein GPALN_003023 [Globodera pallida]
MEWKQFMRKLMSEKGEGSWLNIYTFMDDKPVEQYKHNKKLRNIHELSKIQKCQIGRNDQRGDVLSNCLLKQLYSSLYSISKMANYDDSGSSSSGTNSARQQAKFIALAESGDAVQMPSLLRTFNANANLLSASLITAAKNGNTEMARLMLEHGADPQKTETEMFDGELTTFSAMYFAADLGNLDLCRMFVLTGRVDVNKAESDGERLLRIAALHGHLPVAIIGASSKFNVDQQLYTKRMVEVRAKSKGIDLNAAKKTIFDEKVERILQLLRTQPGMAKVRATDAVIEHPLGKNGKITVNRQAEWEMEGKATELLPVHFKPIPFDILFCAGGAHDQIRDDLLGKPVRRSISKNYGIVVFEKGNPDENVFDNLTAFFNVKMRAFEPILRAQKFDQFVENHKNILPKKFFEKYRNLTQLIVRGLAHDNNKHEVDHEDRGHTKPIYKTDANGHFVLADQSEDPRQIVRLFENRPTLHVASITPPAVEEFVRDIKKELRSEKSAEKQKQINEIRLQFERKWSAAIFDMCLKNGHPEKVGKITINMDDDGVPGKQFSHNQLNIDPHPANTSTFALTIFSVENAVRAIDRESKATTSKSTTSKATTSKSTKGKSTKSKSKAIIAAIGDANTSPHFMTTSGLSTGRLGVEWAAYALRDYHQGQITESKLIDRMREKLNSIQRRVIKKVREYVTIVDKEGKNEAESSNLDKNEANVFKSLYRSDAGNA